MSSTVQSVVAAEAAGSTGRAAARGERAAAPSVLGALAPIMVVVLVAYLIIGLAMPVLPLYVHHELGLSTFMVGVAAGVEFAAALLSRFWSGRYADTRGAKPAMVVGLVMGAVPALGFLANHAGIGSVFLIGSLVVLSAAAVAARLLRAPAEVGVRVRR